MSYCSNCGKELAENEVCTCMGGTSTQAQYTAPQPQPVYTQAQPAYDLDALVAASPKYKPISAWGYFGYELLFCIPCIGFIFLIVYALGGTANVNLKSFARSYFCMLLISIIISLIILVILGGSLGALASMAEFSYSL